jgi:RNA polymerase sigma factor (sigma-70 family)
VSRAEQRLEQLAETHGPRVVAYLARRTDHPADAADVFQAVLLVAWRRLPDVPSDDQAALAWLLATARRCLANDRKSQTRRLQATQRLGESVHVSNPSPPEDHPSLTEALMDLNEADRELVTLVYWEDLTIEQAAQVLNLFAPTARKRLERARTRLRAHLELSRIDASCEPS